MSSEITDWQLQKETLSERGKYLLKSELWSDCKFIVGTESNQREFKAHKLFLSMASPVFDAMFHNGFQEKDSDILILDIQPEAFATMLTYIYSDELKLHSFDQACELCYVANKYMMPFLVKQCTSYIWKDVDFSSVCRAFEFAKLFDQNQLIEKCKQIICTETMDILKHRSFIDVESSTLSMILDQDELFIGSEMDLFKAVCNWVNSECQRKELNENQEEEKRKIAEPLMQKLRFLSMTPAEFAEGPGLCCFLTQAQSFGILMNISSPASGYPMPPGFSAKREPRTLHLDNSINHQYIINLELSHLEPIQNVDKFDSTLMFHTNKDIKLHGIQMLGQLYVPPGPILSSTFPGSKGTSGPQGFLRYRENVELYLEDETGLRLESLYFKSCCDYNSPMDLLFGVPVRLSRCRHYRLVLLLNQPGLYRRGSLTRNSLVYKSVMFTFVPLPDSPQPTSLVCGIIFSN